MIINLVIIAGMQLSTAWCNKFSEFLVVRALFGIAMGGIWGLASSMGLESEHLNQFIALRVDEEYGAEGYLHMTALLVRYAS